MLHEKAERDLSVAKETVRSSKKSLAAEAKEKLDWLTTRLLPFLRLME